MPLSLKMLTLMTLIRIEAKAWTIEMGEDLRLSAIEKGPGWFFWGSQATCQVLSGDKIFLAQLVTNIKIK